MPRTPILAPDTDGIARAAAALADGLAVGMPTETVYGLAANARDGQAVAHIYAAKGRPSFNPLIVHVADLAAARQIGVFTPEAETLAGAFWPGPLTLVLPLRADAGIASLVTAGLDTVGIRIPAHPVARALLTAFGGAVAAPSANESGRISPTTAAHVLDPAGGLDGRLAAVLDGGPCAVGIESTIIGWRDGRATLLRPGGVPVEAVAAVLNHPVGTATTITAPDSPGQLPSHYAPTAPVRLNAGGAQDGETFVGFGTDGPFTLSSSGDLTEAAARLFDILRAADRLNRPIAVAPIPELGLGLAINDRLRRAAAPR